MNKTFFIFALLLTWMGGAAQAQTARQLYLGYENDDKIASVPEKVPTKLPPVKKGKPGTKVVIERSRAGKLAFVAPNSKFRSGDKIRLRFATNFDGYLKILNIGSSGKINLLYPYQGADERIQPSKDFQIPKNGDWIVFDDTPGTEVLSVIMSSQPLASEDENDLRKLNEAATGSRDLTVQSDAEATYAVADNTSLQQPIGFTLRLKHR